MKRRDLFLPALACALAPAALAADQPWAARLLRGGFDGRVWWSGLAVALDPRWKTYWRVPGDGGIAPQFELTGENLASSAVHYPLPHRFIEEAGMTIGYKEAVVFPVSLQPGDIGKPVRLSLNVFFGVCDEVCIPARFSGDVTFDSARSDAPDQALISQWKARTPVQQETGPVLKATPDQWDGKPALRLELSEAVHDIFVEGNPLHYFGSPMLMRGMATLPVSGIASADELRGQSLRITLDVRGAGLEQRVTVV